MQERAYEKRGEQYLLIKSPPASGKSRALMFIALDKLHNQGLRKAIITVPERTIGASFADEPLSKFGFWADWHVEPKWNLCNAPGSEGGKAESVRGICTHLRSGRLAAIPFKSYPHFFRLLTNITGTPPDDGRETIPSHERGFPDLFGFLRKVRWCPGEDSNLHGRNGHWYLKPARLPIPPPGL